MDTKNILTCIKKIVVIVRLLPGIYISAEPRQNQNTVNREYFVSKIFRISSGKRAEISVKVLISGKLIFPDCYIVSGIY